LNVVVDASVAIKWVIDEELTAAADRLFGRGFRLTAPDLLLVECANAVWKKVGRGEITEAYGDEAMALLRSFALDLRPTATLVEAALTLAHELHHPIYDCLYLAMAQATRGVVVTADRRFLAAVSGSRLAARVTWVENPPGS
jgi:predicted nucleic acid-binding protein